MKYKQTRRLYHYHPEILGRKELPVNFFFTQFFALDIEYEEKKSNYDELFLYIRIDSYQTNHYGTFNTLGKPISKMIR